LVIFYLFNFIVSDEFELVPNVEQVPTQEVTEEVSIQANKGGESEDDFGIEEDEPIEKARMIKSLRNIKDQIKDPKWEEKERAREEERTCKGSRGTSKSSSRIKKEERSLLEDV
jgi:hypothetical protein